MIYLIHENNKVAEVLDNEFKPILPSLNNSITDTLFYLAKQYPNELLVWCQKAYKHSINKEALNKIFHHEAILASYSASDKNFLPQQIGYVDHQIYLKINKKVTFPTWLMSSDIGAIYANLLRTVFKGIKKHRDFDYFINSLAKKAMPQGLFCYSEPELILDSLKPKPIKQASSFKLFQFVKQHYKLGWVFFLFFCYVIYERKFPLFQLLNSFKFSQQIDDFNFEKIQIKSSRKLVIKKNVDVIIPTLGRKNYLYDVLRDLSKQTVLPKNVIIIEQNPDPNSESELEYLSKEKWPFKIKHKFINRTGVCNARNTALSQVESEWTLLGDDDNRFQSDLIECLLDQLERIGTNVVTTVYIQPNENQTYLKTSQTPIFGGGNSFFKSLLLEKVRFDPAYEFGYGEDNDFGMQLRNIGEDVIFFSNISITHLKAPLGGYRIKHKNQWDDEKYKPKPSPTIMLFNQRYLTKHQMLGYKLLLFIKFYKDQLIKNPFRYISQMNKRWNSSVYWSKILANKNA